MYEEKVDGYRMVAYKDGDEVRLISRQSKDFTARFPKVTSAIRALRARTVILAWRKVKQPKYREVERGFYKPERVP